MIWLGWGCLLLLMGGYLNWAKAHFRKEPGQRYFASTLSLYVAVPASLIYFGLYVYNWPQYRFDRLSEFSLFEKIGIIAASSPLRFLLVILSIWGLLVCVSFLIQKVGRIFPGPRTTLRRFLVGLIVAALSSFLLFKLFVS
jgi:hypothetical protein